jgi:predicted XRE-type DNA-binding protein
MRPKQPDPIDEMKRAVGAAIVAKIERWSQEKAAGLLRTDQPRVSNLRNGKLDRFSLEQLIRMATRIHGYVYIEIRFRQDQVGPPATTRAPAGQPPDIKRLTWIASETPP